MLKDHGAVTGKNLIKGTSCSHPDSTKVESTYDRTDIKWVQKKKERKEKPQFILNFSPSSHSQ